MSTRKIAPGILLVAPDMEPGSAWQSPNLYLIGDEDLTLIDAGYDRPAQVAEVLAAVGNRKLRRLVLTHCHVDHAGGVRAIREATGAEVWAHRDEKPALERRFPGQDADRWLDGTAVIEAGDYTLELLVTPGHARGHLALYERTKKMLFSGDLVTGEGSTLVAPPEGNMKDYMNSLRMVGKLDISLLLPGHGPVVELPQKRVRELIFHRELREVCIVKCLAESGPLGLKDLVKAMYLGLIHPHLEGAAAGTAWAHLEKLMEEGAVVGEPPDQANPFNMTFHLAPGLDFPFL